jgi:hypothetical protein
MRSLVVIVAVVALSAMTSSAAAQPDELQAARAFCENALGGDFQVGGVEPTGLPVLYACLGGLIRDPDQLLGHGTVDTFVTLCQRRYGGGFVEVSPEGDYYCAQPGV